MNQIKLKHVRAKDGRGVVQSRGGFTLAAEVDKDMNVLKYGLAKCRHTDNFNKRIGIIKATSRLNSIVDQHYTNLKYGELIDNLERFTERNNACLTAVVKDSRTK
jgi:hypothetical protein